MFTGIIEDVGAVKSVEKKGAFGRITVGTALNLSGVALGESIAVNGACLTVTGLKNNDFTADMSEETLRLTTLGGLRTGERVNLERAVTLSKPLGGHLVTGHVDGVGVLKEKAVKGDYIDMAVSVDESLLRQIVKKGAVAVDGISLTVADITGGVFRVAVIPHTLKNTALAYKETGARLNIETDIIAKYVERFLLGAKGNEGACAINEGFLAEHGFSGKKRA